MNDDKQDIDIPEAAVEAVRELNEARADALLAELQKGGGS